MTGDNIFTDVEYSNLGDQIVQRINEFTDSVHIRSLINN